MVSNPNFFTSKCIPSCDISTGQVVSPSCYISRPHPRYGSPMIQSPRYELPGPGHKALVPFLPGRVPDLILHHLGTELLGELAHNHGVTGATYRQKCRWHKYINLWPCDALPMSTPAVATGLGVQVHRLRHEGCANGGLLGSAPVISNHQWWGSKVCWLQDMSPTWKP